MKIATDQKRFVLVTGLSRSGTTLIASILNSCDNAVILSEPNNCIRVNGWAWMDKLGTEPKRSRMMAEPDIIPFLDSFNIDLAGVKEVLLEKNHEETDGPLLCDYAIDRADLVLVSLRDPIATFASQREKTQVSLSLFLRRVRLMKLWIERCRKPIRFVRYEEMCADPLAAINKAAAGFFSIEGPLEKKPMQGYGDWEAMKSEIVSVSRTACAPVSDIEKALILTATRSWKGY